jgi:hypothetical protein
MHGIMRAMVYLARCLILVSAGLALGASCAKKATPKDPWETFTNEYCNERVDRRLKNAGYQPKEKPLNWKKPYEEGKTLIVGVCVQELSAAIHPCSIEYTYGSDSAIQCVSRYTDGFLAQAAEAFSEMIPDKQQALKQADPMDNAIQAYKQSLEEQADKQKH